MAFYRAILAQPWPAGLISGSVSGYLQMLSGSPVFGQEMGLNNARIFKEECFLLSPKTMGRNVKVSGLDL
ncbi:MAG: hypothetical protein ACRERU_18925 [Methylococcales bacterium]